jgi:signal transduction histidine kinase/GAF domain-containing protein
VNREQNRAGDPNQRLLEAVNQINCADDLEGALAALLDEAIGLLACDGASVMWLSGDELEVLASRGEAVSLPGLILPVSQVGAARIAMDSSRPVLVVDTEQDARWRRIPGEERVRAWLGAPLLLDERPIGLVEWTACEPGLFQEKDAQTAQELARYAAPILYRIRLLDDTRQRLREILEPRLSRPIQAREIGEPLQKVAREALDLTGARHAFAFLLEEGSRGFRCVAACGEQQEQLRKVVLRGDGTFNGWTVSVPAPRAADASPSDGEIMAALGITHALILPLRVGREPVGMLGVAEPRAGRSFDQGAMRLMAHLASQASLIVERDRPSKPTPDHGYDYETAFQSAPLGLCVLTVRGDIQACNSVLAGLLSRVDRNLVGRNLSDFLAPADWRRLLHALEAVAVTGQRQQVDTCFRSTQGEQRHGRLTLAPVYAASPAATRMPKGQTGFRSGGWGPTGVTLIAVLEDVTSLKILEQERVEHLRELREKHNQLQDLDQLRTRFVSNVSHELRTPLAVIKLYATLARKGRPEKQLYYLQTIEQETHRLETMVENILDLTRIDRHTLHLHPELLAAEEIIAQVLEVYQETAQKRGIELRNHVQGDLPRLLADKNDLIQMLTNLVDNGLKYTPQGGQVWIAARETMVNSQPVLEIAVGDTGIGIPEDEQGKIFERFYRGANNTAGSTGTGLGLAIVQELMAQHSGRVTLTSQVNKGSIFVLQFPLAHLTALQGQDVPEPPSAPLPPGPLPPGPLPPVGTGGKLRNQGGSQS